MNLLIQNAQVILPDGIEQVDVLAHKGQIAAIGHDLPSHLSSTTQIDATGLILSPGWIDLQLNGGFGHDFTQDPASIWPVAKQLPRYGVTSFLPTIITSPLETIVAAQAVLQQTHTREGAIPLGLHLEGPYLNPAKKGAHAEAWIRKPNVAEIADWSPQTGVRLVTLAPEMEGGLDLVQRLAQNGVLVSAGHSTATYAQADAGFEAGIRYGTHLFNAMPLLHHREPGLIGALLTDSRLRFGLIPDGVHLHPATVRAAWEAAGDRLNVVTDSMAAMGMGPGRYRLAGREVTVYDRAVRLADGTLAGSLVTLDQALRNLKRWTNASLEEIIATVTSTPADLLGMLHKGRIHVGADADFVLLDQSLTVVQTIIHGVTAYDQRNSPIPGN